MYQIPDRYLSQKSFRRRKCGCSKTLATLYIKATRYNTLIKDQHAHMLGAGYNPMKTSWILIQVKQL